MSVITRVCFCLMFVAVLCFALPPSQAEAGTCNKSHGNCDVTVQTSVFTGSPTVICLIGHPVVKIVVTVTCSGQSAGPFEKLTCGVQSGDFVFVALGYTHTLSVENGSDWEAILNGNCDDLKYRRHPN